MYSFSLQCGKLVSLHPQSSWHTVISLTVQPLRKYGHSLQTSNYISINAFCPKVILHSFKMQHSLSIKISTNNGKYCFKLYLINGDKDFWLIISSPAIKVLIMVMKVHEIQKIWETDFDRTIGLWLRMKSILKAILAIRQILENRNILGYKQQTRSH